MSRATAAAYRWLMTHTTTTCVHCGAPASGNELYCSACGLAFIPDSGASAMPPPAWPAPGAATPAPAMVPTSGESRNWALAAHLTAMAGALVGGVAAFVGPLLVWLLRRDTDPFAAEHARQALNFNLSVLVYALVGIVGGVVLTVLTVGLALLVLVPLAGVAVVGYAVVSVLGARAASRGRPFSYPGALPLVS